MKLALSTFEANSLQRVLAIEVARREFNNIPCATLTMILTRLNRIITEQEIAYKVLLKKLQKRGAKSEVIFKQRRRRAVTATVIRGTNEYIKNAKYNGERANRPRKQSRYFA